MNGISLVNLTIVEQLCVAQLAIDTSDTGGTNGRRAVTAVLKDSIPALGLISAKVPVVAVSGTIWRAVLLSEQYTNPMFSSIFFNTLNLIRISASIPQR